jgi:hypothetical protein
MKKKKIKPSISSTEIKSNETDLLAQSKITSSDIKSIEAEPNNIIKKKKKPHILPPKNIIKKKKKPHILPPKNIIKKKRMIPPITSLEIKSNEVDFKAQPKITSPKIKSNEPKPSKITYPEIKSSEAVPKSIIKKKKPYILPPKKIIKKKKIMSPEIKSNEAPPKINYNIPTVELKFLNIE